MSLPYGAFVNAIPLPGLVIRADERIEAANALAEALLGRGLTGRHFITALRQPAVLDQIEQCLNEGEAGQAAFLTSDNDRDQSYEVSVRPVPVDRWMGALVTFTDVTPLEEAGQIRRDFVANVSHELRTPLTALMGFIETLKGPAANDEKARARFLDIMEAEAGRMNRLVGDLLSLSRVEADARVRPTGRVELTGLIRSVLHGLTGVAGRAEVTLDATLPERLVHVRGDADQLRQVLTNLIENGTKYCGRGATVAVRLTGPTYQPAMRADGVQISVRDTGPGIETYHLPRLTERFYRVDSHRSRQMGGTGLGLAIVKHIVNRHRGRLRIESTYGEGSTFTVILPVG